MTAVTAQLNTMQIEECKFEASVSEAVMTRMAAVVNYLAQNAIDTLGTVIQSALTEAQFATLKGYDHTAPYATRKWVLMTGASISGSDFANLTGITSFPDAVTNGAFLGQKKPSHSMTEYQTNQNQSHTHTSAALTSQSIQEGGSGNTSLGLGSTGSSGGDEARPNNIRVNIFIKINNQ